MYIQSRRMDSFVGERLGHLKAIWRNPGGGTGAKGPRKVAKFFKRCKVLENESSFQKYHHFFRKKSIFLRKN